jgi:hypothetical protein
MSVERQRLPNRRASETFDLSVGKLKYRCTTSKLADGTLGEIFLSNGKSGSDSDTAARDSAVVCSIALQFGVPVEVIRHAWLGERPLYEWACEVVGGSSNPLGRLEIYAAMDADTLAALGGDVLPPTVWVLK